MSDKIHKKNLPAYFDIQGHRGCRGLLPENSISAFLNALELGVTTLEMDLVISKDKQVVVSHDPYFSNEFSLTPEGKEISPKAEKSFNLYQMNYEEIKKFDTGSKIHPRFPTQKKIKTSKPLLNEVIDVSEKYIKDHQLKPIQYNIEIKSTPEGDKIFHPPYQEFADIVYELIKEKNIIDRTLIQCFDLRTLQYIRKKYPSIKLSLLIENPLPANFNIKILGFVPEVYSPYYKLVDDKLIQLARSLKFKVIPWTVNNTDDINKLIHLGVDGVITDYPDLFD